MREARGEGPTGRAGASGLRCGTVRGGVVFFRAAATASGVDDRHRNAVSDGCSESVGVLPAPLLRRLNSYRRGLRGTWKERTIRARVR